MPFFATALAALAGGGATAGATSTVASVWGALGVGQKAAVFGKIAGGIKGFFGGKRDEANKRAERRMYRKYANQATSALQAQIPEEQQYASQRSQFLRERGEFKQATILDSYERNVEKMDMGVGTTGMAYGADENLRRGNLLDAYQNQTGVAQLAQEEQYMGIQRDYQSRLRDIEGKMLDVQRYAADKGVVSGVNKGKISPEQNQTNFGGYR